jgi:hypothetical protein
VESRLKEWACPWSNVDLFYHQERMRLELAGGIIHSSKSCTSYKTGAMQRQIFDEFQLIPSKSMVSTACAIEEVYYSPSIFLSNYISLFASLLALGNEY